MIREVVERRINDYESKAAAQPAQRSDDVPIDPNTVTEPSVSLESQQPTTLHTQEPVLDTYSSQTAPGQEKKPEEEGSSSWQNDQTELRGPVGEELSQPEGSLEPESSSTSGQ